MQPLIKSLRYATIGTLSLLFLYSGDDRPSQLKQVQERGSMTLLTRNGASSYYLGPDGPTGKFIAEEYNPKTGETPW